MERRRLFMSFIDDIFQVLGANLRVDAFEVVCDGLMWQLNIFREEYLYALILVGGSFESCIVTYLECHIRIFLEYPPGVLEYLVKVFWTHFLEI